MSDETNAAVANPPTTLEQVFDDPFEGSPSTAPAMEALQEELQRREIEPQLTEEQLLPGEEMSAEEILATFTGEKKEEPAEPVAEAQAEAEAEPEVDAFEAMLSSLNELAGAALGQTAVAAPVEPVVEAPVAAPAPVVPSPAFNLDVTEDTLYQIATDPAAYKNHMAQYAEHIKLETMREIGPSIISTAFEAFYAAQFENDVVEKYPQIAAEAPNLLVVAYRKAKEAAPNAPYNQLRDSIFKTLDSVLAKKTSIEKSGKQKDVRGRFAPEKATRTARPAAPAAKRVDPTEEAFGMINNLSAGRGSDLLNIFGP